MTAAGIAMIAATLIDLLLTVLHPTRSGPLSRLAMTATWAGCRAIGSWSRIEGVMSYGGPLVMLSQLITWVLGLWLGFALLYAGYLDRLGASPELQFGELDIIDALYLSGVALTTVGFGDLVAETDGLRLLTVLEAASGLAVITAAISYLLSVYPLVSQIRAAARQVAPAQRGDEEAAELIVFGGDSRLVALERDLIELDESTQRFPVLYYFHSKDPTASLAGGIRGASLVVMQLRFGLDTGSVPDARWRGQVLEATLTSVIEHFRERFHARAQSDSEPPRVDLDRRLAELRSAGAQVTGTRATDEVDRDALLGLVSRTNSFLATLERRHAYGYEPV